MSASDRPPPPGPDGPPSAVRGARPLLRVAPDGELLFANAAAAPILGSWGIGVGDLLPAAWRWRVAAVVADGTPRELEAAYGGALYSLVVAPGRAGVSLFGRDLTAWRRAERATRRYEFIVNNSKDLMSLITIRCVYEAVSDSYCLAHSRSRDELVGHTVAEVWGREAFEAVIRGYLERCFGGREVRYQAWFSLPALGRRCFEVTYTPYRDGSGGVSHAVVVSRDITESKLAEQRLRESEEELLRATRAAEAANEAKGQFLATVSHETRTPLNVILGTTELALAEAPAGELRESLRTISANAEALLRLINKLLDFSRLESGSGEAEAVPFDPGALVSDVGESLGVEARRKGLTLDWWVDPSLPTPLLGDPARLRQVLVNLVGNAVKFTERGEISLSLRRATALADGEVGLHYAVSDTGIGIAEADRERIFERFVQADGSTSRRFGGTGLGLAISRSLVELMGGRIWVESALGEGSRFHVELSLPPAPAGLRPLGRQAKTPVARRRARVLVAEDNPDSRLLLLRFLDTAGYRAEGVADGESAVTRAAAGELDLILMDVEMPGLDGLAATRRIRRDERLAGRRPVPVAAVTAHAVDGFRERCLAAGCDDFVVKPVSRNRLLAAVDRCLEAPVADLVHEASAEPPPEASVPIPVAVDPDVFDLVPAYLARCGSELEGLRAALAADDLGAVGRAAHRLKGSGGSYGFAAVSELGSEMEQAARDGRRDAVAAAAERLADYLARVAPRLAV